MKELVEKVVQWGVDRGLDKVGHLAQAKYTLKETAELLDAYADQDIGKINDAIGDILVTLIVGASNDNEILDSMFYYIEENEGSLFEYVDFVSRQPLVFYLSDTVEMVLQLNIKCASNTVSDNMYNNLICRLSEIVDSVNYDFNTKTSLKECLQLAYDEIKDRTGKMVNGQFIKDS